MIPAWSSASRGKVAPHRRSPAAPAATTPRSKRPTNRRTSKLRRKPSRARRPEPSHRQRPPPTAADAARAQHRAVGQHGLELQNDVFDITVARRELTGRPRSDPPADTAHADRLRVVTERQAVLDRSGLGAMQRDHLGEAAVQLQQALGEFRLGVGDDNTVGDVLQVVTLSIDHAPTGLAQPRIKPKYSHYRRFGPQSLARPTPRQTRPRRLSRHAGPAFRPSGAPLRRR